MVCFARQRKVRTVLHHVIDMMHQLGHVCMQNTFSTTQNCIRTGNSYAMYENACSQWQEVLQRHTS